MLHNRGLTLTVEIHRASSCCNGGYPRAIRGCRPAARAPSPLKTTALRVIRDAGYPHGPRIRRAIEDARPATRHRPAIHAGSGSSADRTLTLTVEMHSAASRFGSRISTREHVLPSLSCSHARVRTGRARRFMRRRRRLGCRLGCRLGFRLGFRLGCRLGCRLGLGRPDDHILVRCPLSCVDAHLCIAGHVESLANAAMRGKIRALQTTPPRSPLECTALRVAADAGISTSGRMRGSATHARVRLECAAR